MPTTGQYGKTPPTCTYAPGSDVEFQILITAYHGKLLHKLVTMLGLPKLALHTTLNTMTLSLSLNLSLNLKPKAQAQA